MTSIPVYRSLRFRVSVKLMLGGVALFAIALALFQQWDYRRKEPGSEKLFRPIISYYEERIVSARKDQKNCLSHALTSSQSLAEVVAICIGRIAFLSVVKPMTLGDTKQTWTTIMIDLRRLRDLHYFFVHPIGPSDSLLTKYRIVALKSELFDYYTRLRGHFQRMRDVHHTVIMPLPNEFEVIRVALQVKIRRLYGDPTFEMDAMPPWYLVPGSPKPKKIIKPVWFGNSL